MAKKDYSSYSKEELIKIIRKLGKRRYGLVWEDKPETLAQECKTKLPVITEDRNKEICTNKDEPTNIFIEGDNYHALWVLNYTHRKKIDVIYIDPPYNTGSRSWKYNNDYVEKEDSFRHSKWLSFMEKRLRLAKNLLKDDGIIIVTIDDYEIGTLRLLMDNIFREDNRLGLVTIVHNPRGRSDDQYFATSHEYALVYGKILGKPETYKLNLTAEQAENFPLEDEESRYRILPLKRTGSNSTPSERPNLFYPIYYNPQRDEISLTLKEGCITIIPKDADGHNRVWRWGQESLLERMHSEIVVKKGRNGAHTIYAKDRIKEGRKPKTVWMDPKYDASSHGTMLLKKILGKRKTFNYPKSLYAVKDLLEICTKGKKQALILDFFAGSGTTGHAMLELNKDGGNRKFILCTNNENQIAENVCYPRIRKVIKGYKNSNNEFISGLGGNLKYYRTDFVLFANTDSDKRALTNRSTEMLCMAEETYDEILFKQGEFSLFENENKITAIIYDEDSINSCKAEIKKYKKSIIIYVFSYDKEYNPEDFYDLEGRIKIKPIPEAILNIYRKIGRK